MYIYPIAYKPIYFRANERFVSDTQGHLVYKTTTHFFREDTDWDMLNSYLCSKYKNTDKVNVICHACSNGMEPYSFAMHMECFHSRQNAKFFPVIAKDIDTDNIKMAKRGHYDVTNCEQYLLDYYTAGKYKNFLDFEPAHEPKKIGFRVNEELKNCVKFEQGDIFQNIENMPQQNTVLFCKNFWPYLTPEKQEVLAKKLSKHFDESCVIITGAYDADKSDVEELMIKYGFHEHPLIKYTWEKLR